MADRFNISVYDIHIALKALPFVEPEPPLATFGLTAKDIMAAPCVTVAACGAALDAAHALHCCEHSAFPVEDDEGRYCGMMVRNWLVLLLERQGRCDLVSSLSSAAHGEGGAAGVPVDVDASAHAGLHDEQHGAEQHGADPLLPDDFRWQEVVQPRCEALPTGRRPLRVSAEAMEAIAPQAVLDLRPYMDAGAVTVTESCPVTQCFELFRALGLRHLPVLSVDHRAVGIITRQELTTDYAIAS